MYNFGLETFLIIVLFGPLFGACLVCLCNSRALNIIHQISTIVAATVFVSSIGLFCFFDRSISNFQFIFGFNWIVASNVTLHFGIDGISLFFVLLTTFLTLICLIISRNSVRFATKEYVVCFLLLETILVAVFTVLDVLAFYVFFEAVLIPMFIIVGVWGGRARKVSAAYQLFFFTLFGSVFFLLAICAILFEVGSTDIQILRSVQFGYAFQKVLWVAFFISFAIKIPMVPVHTWLPEAHVEAPTAGSVILAGILLKLGGYAFLRFSLPMLPQASYYFTPLVICLSIVGIIYVSFTTLRQVDLKKIIAYSSVGHMAYVTLGLFSWNSVAIEGAIFLMIAHGIVSPALFLCVGVLYDRHKTRIFRYYTGLSQVMPVFSTLFLIFSLANLGFPTTSNFIGEFLVLLGAFQQSRLIGFLASLGMVLGAAYSLWLWVRVCCGNLKVFFVSKFSDLHSKEALLFLPVTIMTFVLGLCPNLVLSFLHLPVKEVLIA